MVPAPAKACSGGMYGIPAPAAVDRIHCLHEGGVPWVRWAEDMHLLIALWGETSEQHSGFLIKVTRTVDRLQQLAGIFDQCRCMASGCRQSKSFAGTVLRLIIFEAVGSEKDVYDAGSESGGSQLAGSLCGISSDRFLQVGQGFNRCSERPGGGN